MASDQLEERATVRLGTVLRGKYRLDRVLGVGGMAAVYKATHRNQAEFAIKMLHPELSLNDDVRTRFLREGYAANSVRHPGAVRVVDDDVAEDGAAFLVMELLDGEVCENLAPDGSRLPLGVACAIALELLEVLAAAHAQGIIHRDIKPANVFVVRDGSIKVLDFGIARVKDTVGGSVRATGTGLLLGTPAYMAPEQAIGKASDVDARADLWAVGATVFGLASGELVHDAETAAHLLVKLATEQPRSLAIVVPGAPPAVVAVVDHALALKKADRWTSAIEMREALASAYAASFADLAPRARLAALLDSQPKAPVQAEGVWTGSAAFRPTAHSPPPRERTPRGASSAGSVGPVVAAAPHVVDTESPVSSDRPGAPKPALAQAALSRRAAPKALFATAAFALIGSAAAVAVVVRGHKSSVAEGAVAPSVSMAPSDPSSSVRAASAPGAPAQGEAPVDAAVADAVATAAPARKEEPPRELPHAAPAVRRVRPVSPAPPTSTAKAEAQPARPNAPVSPVSASPVPVTPRVDPLDGRR